MDRQGHNTPLPPTNLLDFAADADPSPEQEIHQTRRPWRSYWAEQYREMEETTNFLKQRLPLKGIRWIMMANEDVHVISNDALVIFARACEMFILELTHKAWVHAQESNQIIIQKSDIVAAVNQTAYCGFLTMRTTEEPLMDKDALDPMNQLAPASPDPPFYHSMQ